MAFEEGLNRALGSDLEEFKEFINTEIEANKNYLNQFFWCSGGTQMTVLNYLIQHHEKTDSTDKIDFILGLSADINCGEPLHQAISAGKIELALHLVGANPDEGFEESDLQLDVIDTYNSLRSKFSRRRLFDMNRRDNEGRTLLSMALDIKNVKLLIYVLLHQTNLHDTTNRSNANIQFQPIHQAIVLNYADAIRLLASEGADLSNPVGHMKDTPLILAARLGKIDALEALMEFPLKRLVVDAENNHLFADQKNGHTAMEELCDRIAHNREKSEAIRGVAILLCRGVEPPRNEMMRSLLANNRVELLKSVNVYLKDKPELVDAFVTQCHLSESLLHNIVYADHSWGSSIRYLFGVPSGVALMVEDLVVRKYTNPALEQDNISTLTTTAAENLIAEKNPLKLYAEFVRRYTQAYDSQLITNRWSTMRWMIAEGRCDWDTVVRYSKNHPTSRTRIIINEMFQPVARVEQELGDGSAFRGLSAN